MNGTNALGRANYDAKGKGGGGGFFYIEDNKDNIFRVLPPWKSLAADGKIAKYYSVHRGIRGTDGKQKVFNCVEKVTWKDKKPTITQECPLCARVKQLEANLKEGQERGVDPELLKKMRQEQVYPLQSENKYYLNVVNQEGKIGVLSVGSKMYNSLIALAKDMDSKGVDITGMTGIFLNFKKTVKFKGDKEAVHQVEKFLSPAADGSYRLVQHELTPTFIAQMEKEAADLGGLFKTLTYDQVRMIESLSGESRSQYMDTLFTAPERTESSGTVGNATVPGTNTQMVATVTQNIERGGFDINTPVLNNTVQAAQQQAAIQQQVVQAQPQVVAPVQTVVQTTATQVIAPVIKNEFGGTPDIKPPVTEVAQAQAVAQPQTTVAGNAAAPAASAVGMRAGTMSDAEFLAMMNKR